MAFTKPTEQTTTEAPKKRDRTIDVKDMKGDQCISKVSTALKDVKDLSVDAVNLGTVKLRAATRDEAQSACAAIKKAGYEATLVKPVVKA